MMLKSGLLIGVLFLGGCAGFSDWWMEHCIGPDFQVGDTLSTCLAAYGPGNEVRQGADGQSYLLCWKRGWDCFLWARFDKQTWENYFLVYAGQEAHYEGSIRTDVPEPRVTEKWVNPNAGPKEFHH